MLRKQRKLQPWRRFGYVILIIIKSGELLLWFSPRIINGLRSYIKHSKGCFIRYPNTLKLIKKNSAAPRFLNHFSVFGHRMKHSSSCLIYYMKAWWTLPSRSNYFRVSNECVELVCNHKHFPEELIKIGTWCILPKKFKISWKARIPIEVPVVVPSTKSA